MKHKTELRYLADVAASKGVWLNYLREWLVSDNPQSIENVKALQTLREKLDTLEAKEALATVVDEILFGFAHSVLVGLDGGTKLAEEYTIELHASTGKILCNYLHELWPEADEEANTSLQLTGSGSAGS